MANKILHLIRHAEIGLPYRSRYLGRTDVPLSEVGRRQAKELGMEFSRIYNAGSKTISNQTEIWISPLVRCRMTWEEMAFVSENSPILVSELAETDFGQWEGKSFQEIVSSHPEEVEKWSRLDSDFSFPGGESLFSFQNRIRTLREKILTCTHRNLILVTHGGVASNLLCLFLGLNLSHYLAFELARPSLATLNLFENGLGRLTGLHSIAGKRAGEWPG